MHRILLVTALTLPMFLLLAFVACTDDDDGEPIEPEATSTAIAGETTSEPTLAVDETSTPEPGVTDTPFEGGQDPVEGTIGAAAGVPPIPVLIDARSGQHGDFDRIVFEFDNPGAGYRVEYVTKPTDCGSGEPSFPEDTPETVGFLQVRFNPAAAHDEMGNPSFEAADLTVLPTDLGTFQQTCDFEAVLTWVFVLNNPRDFRITALDRPPRLVLDVASP